MSNAVIVAEIPVVTVAAFTAFGWWVNRLVTRLDGYGAKQGEHTGALAEHDLRLAQVESLVNRHDRILPQIGEDLAVVVNEVERLTRIADRSG